jgi:hypothetical protein
MSKNDLIEHSGFIVIVTSNEEVPGEWQGSYHISFNGQVYWEKSVRPLRTTKEAAEKDALDASKVVIDDIVKSKSSLSEYRGRFIKLIVGKVKDGNYGPRWHAAVVIEAADRSTSIGFVDAEPGPSIQEAAVNGVLAGREAIDRVYAV